MRKIKSIIATLLTFILMLSLTGCGEIKKAETAVNGMFAAFKSLNFEEAQKLVADGKTKELVSEALPSAYSPTVEDRVRNHQQLNSDELPITNQSLVDMLCLAYQQYRGQVSLDFIKNKANLTSAKKKKILDDFSDLLEREITQDLDK